MKKIFTLLLCIAMLFTLVACSAGSPGDEPQTQEKPGDTMSLEEIFESIQKGVKEMPSVGITELTDEQYENFLFIEPIEGAVAVASEGMISAVAHSAVLLRVPDGTDVENVAAQIKENANPSKWICVTAEKTEVAFHGNTILLVMSFEDVTDTMVSGFDALWA